MKNKQNNNWTERWEINKELQSWNLNMMDEKEILSFIKTEIDKAVEETIEKARQIILSAPRYLDEVLERLDQLSINKKETK